MALDTDGKNRVLVVDKVAAILRAFVDHPGELRLSELARSAGLPTSSAHRLATSLEGAELLERDDSSGAYRLGRLVLELASVTGRYSSLTQDALPVLQELLRNTGQTVFVCVPRDGKAVCIQRLAGSHVDVLALPLGGSMPLYCGGASRVLLASLSDAELDAYLEQAPFTPMTPRTLTSADELRADVARTRAQGYALSDNDVTLGVCALGVPVRGGSGEVVAALSVADLTVIYSADRIPDLVETLTDAARRISARAFGWTDAPALRPR